MTTQEKLRKDVPEVNYYCVSLKEELSRFFVYKVRHKSLSKEEK